MTDNNSCWWDGYNTAKKLFERPKGEWIIQRHDLAGCFYTCSNCGRMIRVPIFIDDPEDNETLADYPFCHCGADMRGSKKETTFEDYLKEQLKDPEFRKEWEKLCDEDMQNGDKE